MISLVGAYLRNRLFDPLLGFLKQGMTPDKLALTVCFGLVWGYFPVLGTSTALCVVSAFIFKLNHAAIQIVNYAVYPLQFLLLVPFLQGGVFMSGSNVLKYDLEGLVDLFSNNLMGAISELGSVLIFGALAWLVFSIPVFVICYFGLLKLFRKIASESKPSLNP